MSDVFVSYSRRDGEFVQGLAQTLEAQGKSVWLDTQGIGDGEVFPEAIRRAIEGSDAFVFVLSPESVRSRYCESEVGYAVELQKRIVPVLRSPVSHDEVPEAIRVRNWIPYTPDADQDAAARRLATALDTDFEHARAHTHWLVKALEWDEAARDSSFLLRGGEMAAAESWLAGVADNAEPAPTALQREYLHVSRVTSARRQRGLVIASLVAVVVAVGLAVFALISRNQAQHERNQAVAAAAVSRSRAIAAESEAQLSIDPGRSLLLAVAAVRVAPTPEAVFALRGALDASPLQRQLANVGPQIPVWGPGVSYSPDGRRLAVGSSSSPGAVTIFAIPSGRVLRRIRLGAPAAIVAFSPDGSSLAVGTLNQNGGPDHVYIVDASTGKMRQGLAAPSSFPNNFAFSKTGSMLFFADFAGNGGVVRWDLRTNQKRLWQLSPSGPVGAEAGLYVVALSPGGRRVAVGGDPGLALLNTATGRVLATADLHRTVFAVAFSPDGSKLAVASGPDTGSFDEGTIALLNPRTLAVRRVVRRIDGNTFTAVAFSPDGTKLAYGGGDGSAGVIELPSGAQSISLPGHVTYVYQVAFSPNGRQLATAAGDGTTLLWRIGGNQQRTILAGRFDPAINGNDVPADLRLLANRVEVRLAPLNGPGRGHEQVLAWSLDGRRIAAPLSILRALPNGLGRLSDDGRIAVTTPIHSLLQPGVGVGGTLLQVWDVRARRITQSIVIPSPINDQLPPAISPDDSYVALSVAPHNGGQAMEIVNLDTRRIRQLKPTINLCQWIISGYSPNGRYVAAGTTCGEVCVWNTATGRQIGYHKFAYTIDLLAPRFSPDGSRLAVANTGNAGQVSILNVATNKVVTVLTAHTGQVEDIAYSPNGKLLATASIDHTVRIWDAHTGRPLRILDHPDPVDAVAFSPNSTTIATLDYAGTIRIWDACTGCENPTALLALAKQRVTRQLTPAERRTFLGN
jgi:WD40 repeat protein